MKLIIMDDRERKGKMELLPVVGKAHDTSNRNFW